MRQVTRNEAQAAGAKSKRAALRSSLKHWEYNESKTIEQLKQEAQNPTHGYLCALCRRYGIGCKRKKRVCPLNRFAKVTECATAYHLAKAAYNVGNEEKWKLYSGELVKILRGLLK